MKNGKRIARIVAEKGAGNRLGAGLAFCEAKPFVLKDSSDNLETLLAIDYETSYTLLCALFQPDLLSERARGMIVDPANEVAVPAALLWEIAIKNAKRPDTMSYTHITISNAIADADYVLLPIKQQHVGALAYHICQGIHNDPFDHLLLLAASSVEQATLLTYDDKIASHRGTFFIESNSSSKPEPMAQSRESLLDSYHFFARTLIAKRT